MGGDDMTTWMRPANCESTACAEVMRSLDGGGVIIRNSRHPDDRVWLSEAEWRALCADIAAGGLGNMAKV